MPAGRDDDALADRFWAVARRLRQSSRDVLAPLDINPSLTRALRVLDRRGPIRLGELSAELGIAARSATEVVDALEARGLVTRQPDPADRRATLVAVTAHGASVMESVRAARRTQSARLFGRLSARDRAELARILDRLDD
jgi:DNA-binding MarR family transcriptional regulator